MAVTIQTVNRGTTPGDGTGDNAYVGTGKINTNFSNLKAAADLVLDVPQDNLLGRITASTGDVEKLTPTQVRTILNVADGANNYSHPNHTGDVTSVGDGAQTIVDNAVTLAKMADVATGTVFYRKTAATGDPEVQTLATLKTDLGLTGTNSGDQTTIVGITGTKAQFDTALTDGNFMYIGDAPTSHSHTVSDISDLTNGVEALTTAEVNQLENIGTTVITAANWTAVSNLSGTNTGDEVAATTTAQGIIELATQAEVDAGTDTSRAITPETLANYSGFPAGGAFTADANTQITPLTSILLDQATGDEIALDLSGTVNKAAGGYSVIYADITETAAPGTNYLINLGAGGTPQFTVTPEGLLTAKNAVFDAATAGGPGSGIKVGTFEMFPFGSAAATADDPTFRSAVTNGSTVFRVLPNGTGIAAFEFFGTDYFTDSANWENIKIQTGTKYVIQTDAAGTGVVRPLSIYAGDTNVDQLLLNIDGTVDIGGALGVTGGVAATGAVTGSNLSGTNTGDQTSIVGITGTLAQFNTALTDATFATGGGTVTGSSSGTNTGDQTSIVGITGTLAQFNTALTDATFATGGGTATGTNTGDQTSIVGITGTTAQFNTALTDGSFATGGGTATGTNTGDQTSIVGITGTKAQFNTACTDGTFLFSGDVTSDTGTPAILSNGATPSLNTGITGAEVRSLIGAGTGNGSVTSVSAGTGMSFTTITGSGSVSIDTTMTAITSLLNTSLIVGYSSANCMDFNLNSFSVIFDSVEDFRFTDGGEFWANGNIVAYSSSISSDRKLKDNIEVISDPMEILDGIKGCTFNWKRDGRAAAGVIAQDVEKVMPRAVSVTENINDPGSTFKVVDYNQLVGVLIEAVKELSAKVEAFTR